MPEVLALARRVEADAGAERPVVRRDRDLGRLAALDALATANSSRPVSPSDSRPSPSMNWSGSTPIIRRFERWMRS